MNGEKTEKATPKRRRDAREKGQVVKSNELGSAIVLLLLYLGFKLFDSMLGSGFVSLMTDFLGYIDISDDFTAKLQPVFIQSVKYFLILCGPVLAISLVSGVIVNYLQVGFMFRLKLLAVKLSRTNPIAGFKRIFSMRSLTEMLKAVLKLIIVGSVVYFEYKKSLSGIPNYINIGFSRVITIIWDTLCEIIWKTGIIFLILGLFDYIYQWWQHEKNLRMTKEEVKQEYKLLEGDPKIKARIREAQRRIGMRRMMQQIKHSDVVITNPTHYAVALKYDDNADPAPRVTAKGAGFVALKIKEKAREHNIYIAENPPLAQTLYRTTDIDEVIPEDLYHAVAQILAVVYRAKSGS